jgi:hypothetical protein
MTNINDGLYEELQTSDDEHKRRPLRGTTNKRRRSIEKDSLSLSSLSSSSTSTLKSKKNKQNIKRGCKRPASPVTDEELENILAQFDRLSVKKKKPKLEMCWDKIQDQYPHVFYQLIGRNNKPVYGQVLHYIHRHWPERFANSDLRGDEAICLILLKLLCDNEKHVSGL